MRLWGGRFTKKPQESAHRFTSSLAFDRRLAEHDIAGSIAHARMLGRCKIIAAEEARELEAGLERVRAGLASGEMTLDPASEDVHTEIERLLGEHIGALAGKLHTARSRNDQVALDLRLFVKDAIGEVTAGLRRLQQAIVAVAEAHLDVIMPGYTHLQHGQLVLLAHHCLAYVEMLDRDVERLDDALKRVDVMPLGACAVAGTTLPIDRAKVAEALGFSIVARNSVDAVSDRDFAVEYLADLALVGVHLSRLGEELVLWSTSEFGFITLGEAFCTGSSMLPQKRNPDVPELVRGHAGRLVGNLVSLLTTIKALPLSYNRDMQHDKQPVFQSTDIVLSSLEVLARMMPTLRVNRDALRRAVEDDAMLAVDLAEYLVTKGVPFRRAHEIVGRVVATAERKRKRLRDLTLDQLRAHSDAFDKNACELLNVERSLDRKASTGSTAPTMVRNEVRRWKRRLGDA